MKEESNIKPIDKYEIEINKDNSCDIILYDLDSIEEIITDEESITYRYYSFRIKINNYNDKVIEYTKNNYSRLLNDAKEYDKNKLATEIRKKRDKLLLETDWTQANDTALSDEMVQAYKEYRQALRDIPEQSGFPYNIVFPILKKGKTKESEAE